MAHKIGSHYCSSRPEASSSRDGSVGQGYVEPFTQDIVYGRKDIVTLDRMWAAHQELKNVEDRIRSRDEELWL